MNHPAKNHTVFPQTEAIPAPLEIHPSVSPLAAELLMKVADILSAEPSSCNQAHANKNYGTACCIMGHMAIIAGANLNAFNAMEVCAQLGLKNDQAKRIFNAYEWPTDHTDEYYATSAQGIARIEFFLRTGQ